MKQCGQTSRTSQEVFQEHWVVLQRAVFLSCCSNIVRKKVNEFLFLFFFWLAAVLRCVHTVGSKLADIFCTALLHFHAQRKQLKIDSEAALCVFSLGDCSKVTQKVYLLWWAFVLLFPLGEAECQLMIGHTPTQHSSWLKTFTAGSRLWLITWCAVYFHNSVKSRYDFISEFSCKKPPKPNDF